MFTWRHPDFLSVFAGGNNAIKVISVNRTDYDEYGLLPGGVVQSPASAKNVLSVGSVFNYVPPGPGSPLIATFTATNPSTGKTHLWVCVHTLADYWHKRSLWEVLWDCRYFYIMIFTSISLQAPVLWLCLALPWYGDQTEIKQSSY